MTNRKGGSGVETVETTKRDDEDAATEIVGLATQDAVTTALENAEFDLTETDVQITVSVVEKTNE